MRSVELLKGEGAGPDLTPGRQPNPVPSQLLIVSTARVIKAACKISVYLTHTCTGMDPSEPSHARGSEACPPTGNSDLRESVT